MCAAFGVLYAFIGARRPAKRRQSLLFSGFALAYAAASLTARASFLSDSTESFIAANRASIVCAGIGFILLCWYVADYSGFAPRWFLWGLTGGFVVLILVLIVAPEAFFGEVVSTDTIVLPWGETVRVLGSDPGIVFILGVLAQLLLIGFIVVAALDQYRHGDRAEAFVLAIGVGWFAAALIVENLSTVGVLDLPPTADFGFLGFLVALSFAMVNESIESEDALIRSQARLEEKVVERTAALEEAQADLVTQIEESAAAAERVRISRELHDAVSQLLFSINLLAGSLPKLMQTDRAAAERASAELQRLARGALAEMRTLLRELRPQTIAQTRLELLISQLAEGVSARMDIAVSMDVELEEPLPPSVHTVVYRVCQEAMANTAKHADASRVDLRLHGGPTSVQMTIADDGHGFDGEADLSGTMGLATMAERAHEIGAAIDIASTPGRGTVVTFEWRATDD